MSDDNLQQTDNGQPSNEVNYESEARAQGWVSKEEFRSDERDWVDAETFVRRGREILPIVRKNNEKLLKELNEAKRDAQEAKAAAKEFQKFQQEQYERKAQELEEKLSLVKQAKREAINSGDGDRVVELDDMTDVLKADIQKAKEASVIKPVEPAKQDQVVDVNLQNWLDKNDWFGVDKRTTCIANGLAEAIRLENPGLQGQAFLQKLDEELSEVLPTKFGKQKPKNPMDGEALNSSASGRQPKGKRSYESLPSDAKAACDRFVKQGLMTKEEYIQSYDWSE
jgi:transcription elongation GreA/GreB family factor